MNISKINLHAISTVPVTKSQKRDPPEGKERLNGISIQSFLATKADEVMILTALSK
jgi:hypothetical protein